MRGLALLLLIIALAGPRWPDPGTRLPTFGISITMVVDVSRSMKEEDFVWQERKISRLDAVKKVFRLFVAGGSGPDGQQLAGRSNDLIGLVTFATRPDTACPLTLNHAALLDIMDAQQPRTQPGEGTTNLGDAVAWALHRLQQAPTKRKVMILLTDGEHNEPPPALKPAQAGQLAANLGVRIYAIHAHSGQPPKSTADPKAAAEWKNARDTLQKLANVTQGRFFAAGDTASLLDVWEQIDQLEREEILSLQYRRYYEGFVWFAVASLGLWLALGILESTVWRRLP
jgi:Ca-activated chloride channel family protein